MGDPLVKTSFAGGELGPEMHGRVDLAKYTVGAAVIRNFVVRLEGGITRRPGSRFITPVKFETRDTIFLPFIKSSLDSIMIEFGHLYMRFIRFGAQITFLAGHVPLPGSETTGAEGIPVELVTPYTEAQLRDVKWTQSNDIIYLFHPSHPPMELLRFGFYDWAINPLVFEPGILAPEDLIATLTEGEAPNAPTDYNYGVSAISEEGEESYLSNTVTVEDSDLEVSKTNWVDLDWDAVAGAERYAIYKSTNSGLFGFIGVTLDLEFKDDNFAPNFSETPIRPFDPFDSADNYPSVGEFIQQRLGYAATFNNPQGLWFSRPSFFNNLSRSIPSNVGDGIEVTIAAREDQTIFHMVPFETMLLFTQSAEWVVEATNGILSAASINPKPKSWYGSDPQLRPITINERVLFVQPMGYIIRDIGYTIQADRFVGDDLTLLARHLFSDRTIVSWCWAEQPFRALHVVFSDGKLAILTYSREQEIWAWTSHETEGEYQFCRSVPEISEQGVYTIVRRYIDGVWRKYIERSAGSHFENIGSAFFVDCGLSYDEPIFLTSANAGATGLVVTAPGHDLLVGDQVIVTDIEGLVAEDESEASDFRVNTYYLVDEVDGDELLLVLLDEVEFPDETLFTPYISGTGEIRKCVTSISGAGHLEGKAVHILADGLVIDNLTVEDGGVTLPFSAGQVHLGLPYESYVDTLSLDIPAMDGARQVRSVKDINVYVSDTRGLMASIIGNPFEIEVKPRAFEPYYSPNDLLKGTFEINPPGEWLKDCRIRLKCTGPLPATIQTVTPVFEYGGN